LIRLLKLLERGREEFARVYGPEPDPLVLASSKKKVFLRIHANTQSPSERINMTREENQRIVFSEEA
jgi:hypothetical protein